jgi:hypothetical protein
MFWIFPWWVGKLSKLEKALIALIAVALFVTLFFKPVIVAYRKHSVETEKRTQKLPTRPPGPKKQEASSLPPVQQSSLGPINIKPIAKSPKKASSTPSVSSRGSSSGAVGSINQGPGSIAQVGGTGNTAIIAGAKDWLLTRVQQINLTTALAKSRGRVRMGYPGQDFAAIRYASALAYAFHEAGWKIEPQVPGYLGSICWPSAEWDCYGLQIVLRDRSGSAASTAIAALSALVPQTHVDISPKNDDDLVDVFVSKAPQ